MCEHEHEQFLPHLLNMVALSNRYHFPLMIYERFEVDIEQLQRPF